MKKKAKIAVIHPFYNERGGAERKSLLMAQGAQKKGYEITIFTFEKNEEKSFKEFMKGLNFVVIPYGDSLLEKWKSLKKMASMLKGYDIIHAHNFPANIVASLAKKKYGIPIVYYCNEPFLYEKGTVDSMNPLLLFAERFLEKRITKNIDCLVGNSEFTSKRISKIFGKPADVRYSGIHTDIYKSIPKKNKHPIVLTQNRLKKEKKIETLWPIMKEVWKKHPKTELWIAGSGDYEQELKKIFKDKRVKFHGALSFEKWVKNYQKADVFVFTARNEPLGMTPVEAMSCGTPVIAHNSGGPRETVWDGKTGFLVNNEKEFAEKILLLLEDKKLYDKMSKQARERVLKDFSLDSMVNGAIYYYEKLLKK